MNKKFLGAFFILVSITAIQASSKKVQNEIAAFLAKANKVSSKELNSNSLNIVSSSLRNTTQKGGRYVKPIQKSMLNNSFRR